MAIRNNPLTNLPYFTEWGGRSWERLLTYAFEHFLGNNLHDLKILEIGSRYGRMSCLFALLGAEVVGVDLDRDCLGIAAEEAQKWAVDDRVKFIHSSDLDIFRDETFDLIFTKSVLAVNPNLEELLLKISAKLKPSGKVVLLENAYGNSGFQLIRYLRRGKRLPKFYFHLKEESISSVKQIFDVQILKKALIPPVYLICGYKRTHEGVAASHRM